MVCHVSNPIEDRDRSSDTGRDEFGDENIVCPRIAHIIKRDVVRPIECLIGTDRRNAQAGLWQPSAEDLAELDRVAPA